MAVLALYGVSRAVYFTTGGHFIPSAINYQFQILDLHQLKVHTVHSLLFLHIQPPLFNGLVALIYWSPFSTDVGFKIVYITCGVVMTWALYQLLVELHFGVGVSAVATGFVVLNPALIAWESTPSYEYLVATLLVLAAYLCIRYARTRRTRDFATFVAVCTAVVLTRSLFHPLWLVLVIAIVLGFARPRGGWKPAAAVLLVPVLLVGGWMLKNEVIFGTPTMSSWFGMNLTRAVIAPLPRHDFDALRARRRLSQLTTEIPAFPNFLSYDRYAPYVKPCHSTSHSKVLSDLVKSNGEINYNAECFLPVYRAEGRDAVRTLESYPVDFLRSRTTPALIYLREGQPFPRARSAFTDGIQHALNWLFVKIWVRADMRGWTSPIFGALSVRLEVFAMFGVMIVAVIGAGIRSALRWFRGRAQPSDLPFVFLGLTVLYVGLVAIAFELGENARFRVMIDPLLIGVSIAMLLGFVRRVAAGRPRRWITARRSTATASRPTTSVAEAASR